MVDLLKTLLELDGFSVVQAAAGQTVLPTARAERPDVVLMDVHLADADGMDLLRQIRSSQDLAGLKVVMSSGLDMEAECTASGCDAFLLKPYPPEQLSKALKRVLQPA